MALSEVCNATTNDAENDANKNVTIEIDGDSANTVVNETNNHVNQNMAKTYAHMVLSGDNAVNNKLIFRPAVINEDGNEYVVIDTAYNYFVEMQKEGIMPNVIAYNVLINGYCKSRKMAQAYGCFAEMEARGLVANKYTYTILINGNCNLGNWNEALRLYIEMVDRGIEPDAWTHTTLLKRVGFETKARAVRYLEDTVLGNEETDEAKSVRYS
ncbi:pentatricopeptide repeat-containing protein, mitochondrial [Artemisia annua]|uniref:Pentatricopeptide repeat-containing protein, mitochondrial n=1 Tax=Artemisia annua TaxID=35608 RepID=A0A2U1KSQ6_ARTAN|nr:pentatricopeptide repeat-containing protein, mitochondrial [Artemisia annua]